ncbi:MAG: hypothetical protein TU35_003005 [Thermoproteus sp. AZ2]|uniref:Uncharacterized protein n=1 Tax=Thermoproteus sp. AZ2 TaxID=1609232 RepID=A0ACC6V0Q4_9CREN
MALVLVNHDTSEELAKFIELHEEAHVKNNHPAKVWLAGALLFGETSAITMDYRTLGALAPYVYVFSAAVMMTTLFVLFIIVRALEIYADIYVFRQLGASSYDYFVKLMKVRYGNWRPPLRTRLTHAQGGLALLFGDPLAAHAPWEYPLAFSPLSAALFLLPLAISFQPAQEHPVAYFLLLFPATLLLIYAASPALRPLSRSSAKGKLTERGALNLSRLLASIYVVALASAVAAKPAGPFAFLITSAFSFLLHASIIKLYRESLDIKKLNLIYLVYLILLNLLIFMI